MGKVHVHGAALLTGLLFLLLPCCPSLAEEPAKSTEEGKAEAGKPPEAKKDEEGRKKLIPRVSILPFGKGDEKKVELEDLNTGLGPGLLSIFPGCLMHGMGLWLAGDNSAAEMLFFIEALEVGAFAIGAWTTIQWGNANKLGRMSIPLALGSITMAASTWLASVFGSFGGAEIAGYPRLSLPAVTVEVGYAPTAHTQFDLNHVLVLKGEIAFGGGFRVLPEARIGMDDDNYRLRCGVAIRFWGPTDNWRKPADDGSFFEVRGAASYHRFGTESFDVCSTEVTVVGRHDLGRIGPSLRGTFVEWHFGYAFEFYDYFRGDYTFGDEGDSIQLLRVGFGVYLGAGRENGPQGEVQGFYDHRSDELTAGMGVEAEGGLLGAVGICGFYDFTPYWGAGFEMRCGEGYSFDLLVRFRVT